MKDSTARPRIASYVVIEKDKKVLFVRRANTGYMDGYYGLPSGKVETSEGYKAAAVREAAEEIGVKIDPADLTHLITLQRNKPDEDDTWVDVFFKVNKYGGQPKNAEEDKHDKIEWLDIDNLPDNVIDYLKFIFDEIKRGNTYAEFGWS